MTVYKSIIQNSWVSTQDFQYRRLSHMDKRTLKVSHLLRKAHILHQSVRLRLVLYTTRSWRISKTIQNKSHSHKMIWKATDERSPSSHSYCTALLSSGVWLVRREEDSFSITASESQVYITAFLLRLDCYYSNSSDTGTWRWTLHWSETDYNTCEGVSSVGAVWRSEVNLEPLRFLTSSEQNSLHFCAVSKDNMTSCDGLRENKERVTYPPCTVMRNDTCIFLH